MFRYVSKEIDLQGGDPFEKSRAMQKIRRGWMDDDAHRFLTVHQKQYLPLHKREVRFFVIITPELDGSNKGGFAQIRSSWEVTNAGVRQYILWNMRALTLIPLDALHSPTTSRRGASS